MGATGSTGSTLWKSITNRVSHLAGIEKLIIFSASQREDFIDCLWHAFDESSIKLQPFEERGNDVS